jgi:hypothetical protein
MRVPRNHCQTCTCIEEIEYHPSPPVELDDVVRERSSGLVAIVVLLTKKGPVVESPQDGSRWYVGPYDLLPDRTA